MAWQAGERSELRERHTAEPVVLETRFALPGNADFGAGNGGDSIFPKRNAIFVGKQIRWLSFRNAKQASGAEEWDLKVVRRQWGPFFDEGMDAGRFTEQPNELLLNFAQNDCAS